MNKIIKWFMIAVGFLAVVVIAMLLLLPVFMDVQKYKPYIERRVSEAVGRPFTMGEKFKASLFPWAGVSLSDLHLGNPPGFDEKDFVSVKSFEIRVKLLPLLLSKFKDIQINHIILNEPRIALIKQKDGKTTWEWKEKEPAQSKKNEIKPVEGEPGEQFSLNSLAVGDLSINNGLILWIDHSNKEKKEVSGLNLQLSDVSLDRPVNLKFDALMDGYPVSVNGKLGPVGEKPGIGAVPFDISVNALKQLAIHLKGRIDNPAEDPKFDIAVDVSSFSLRKLLSETGQPIPAGQSDPGTLNKVALKAHLKGNPQKISVSDGVLKIDESKINFSVNAKDFSRPDVTFKVKLDQIDLNRYLPPKTGKKSDANKKSGSSELASKKPAEEKTDYSSLRSLVLNGSMHAGKVKVNKTVAQDINVKISGKNGIFHINPLTMKLYNGDMSSNITLNVKKNTPQSNIKLKLNNIECEPLIKDVLEKDILKGTVKAGVALSMSGDDAEKIMKTLNGKGEFSVKNGAVKGIDLVAMVRNTDGAYGFAGQSNKKSETGFSELYAPFTITDGLLKTTDTRMVSTLIRVAVSGKANLPGETLKFRIEPVVVTTSKADKKKMKRSEVKVPVLVSGTFSSPKFRPDLKAIAKDQLKKEVFESKEFKKVFKKKKYAPYEDAAKSLLKGLLDEKE
ncbi:MAG: AsmA family protein [Desulfobacterales bacterium]|nr:AsmA family protein [Desulfobacterales bacterium]MDX2508127.1 AsmA family protein [Desulfobacterales bacterium]